jgi:pimeloyl-ACP methyl ester carboxylesterase
VLKSFAGGRLFGGAWGQGRPSVIALHGWARTHVDFEGVFAGPDSTTGPVPSVIGPDLPGFGATPPPSEPRGTEWYAEQLLPLFDADQLAERVVLVGHSFGGKVAVALQQSVPERVERLVLTGVPLLDRKGRRRSPPLAFRLGRGLHRAGLIGEERMERLRMRYGSADYRAASGVMRGVLVRVLAERYDAVLPRVTCPVDLLWGADDHEVPVEVAERAARILPDPTLEVVEGVGHLLPLEAPAALLHAVRSGATAPSAGGGPVAPPVATSPAERGRPSGSQ